jgi:hypothetical protein
MRHIPYFPSRFLASVAVLLMGTRFLDGGDLPPATSPTTQPLVSIPDIHQALPPGHYTAYVVTIMPTARQMELTQCLQKAFAADPQWIQNYIKQNAKDGEPLPYDPKFGLSNDEYQEFLKLAKDSHLGIVDHFDMAIEAAGADGIQLHAPPRYAPMDGITINFGSGEVTTRFGKISLSEPVAAIAHNFGPSSGQTWQYHSGDPNIGTMVEATLSIGRFEMGGDWLIRYTDGKIKNGVAVEPGSNILIVLRH